MVVRSCAARLRMEKNPTILSGTLSGKYVILTLDETPICSDGQIAVSETGEKALVVSHRTEMVTIEPLFEFALGKHFKVHETISFAESTTKK